MPDTVAHLNYQKHRQSFKDGDILLFCGKGPLSWIIRWKTKSVYSHAGIVAWWGERLMVLEAIGKGVIASPISQALQHYHGGFDYFALKETTPISQEQRNKMVHYAQNQIGKPYNTRAVILFFFRLLFGLRLSRSDIRRPASKFFCSHYVAAIYNTVGLDLIKNLSDNFTSPEEIAKSPLIEFIGRIKEQDA